MRAREAPVVRRRDVIKPHFRQRRLVARPREADEDCDVVGAHRAGCEVRPRPLTACNFFAEWIIA